MFIPTLISLVDIAFRVLTYLIFAHIILSWFPQNNKTIAQISSIISEIVNPVLAPFRRLLPTVSLGGLGLDLTPIIAIFVLGIVRWIVITLLFMLL